MYLLLYILQIIPLGALVNAIVCPLCKLKNVCHRPFLTLPGTIVGRYTRSQRGSRVNDYYNVMDMVDSTLIRPLGTHLKIYIVILNNRDILQ